MFKALIMLAAGAAIVGPVGAQSGGTVPLGSGLGQVQALATLKGTCQQFLMAGRDLSRNCNGAILNTSYANGRTSFLFAFRDGSIVSFYGRDTKAVGGRATMWVEKITVKDAVRASRPEDARAIGRCDYGNAFVGSATITCSAVVAGRRFVGKFVSDGQPPVVTRS